MQWLIIVIGLYSPANHNLQRTLILAMSIVIGLYSPANHNFTGRIAETLNIVIGLYSPANHNLPVIWIKLVQL